MLDCFGYEEYSYGQTKQWESSLNKAEEWANKLYQAYPNVDSAKISATISKALSSGIDNYNDVCSLLLE